MTSVNVFNLGSIRQGPAVNADSAAGKTKAGSTRDVSVFASMMNAGYSTGNQYSPADVKANTKVQNAAESHDWAASKGSRIQTADAATVEETLDGSQETLEDFEENVIQTVAEDLGIREDAVREALEVLGLTVFDLMDPQNLVQLAMQLTSENSPAALLTNPQFLDLMQEVGTISTQLMEDLALAPEQMEELVAQMDAVAEEERQIPVAVTKPEAETAEIPAAASQQKEKEAVVTVTSEGAIQPEEEETQVNPAGQKEQQDAALKQQGESSEPERKESGSMPERHTDLTPEHPQTPFMQAAAEVEIPLTQPAAEQSYLSVDTMDIIKQIAENVRVNLSQAETSMEMQLNPENLGKIYLQISAKQGAVSAQIAASNEAVKVALEAQVAKLQESLDQAGVKVDAIEVTVASHEFEKNLEQNFTREQQEGEQQEKQASHRRNLNLSSLDELSSVMTEEEALAAQIMRDNGNSVDLTA